MLFRSLLSDAPRLLDFFFTYDYPIDEAAVRKWFGEPHIPQMLEELIRRYEALEPFTAHEIERVTREVIA